jgi:hypothetical protein
MIASKVRPSEQIGMNGGKHWRWTKEDIKKIKQHKAKHFREGQGRRAKTLRKSE